MHIDVKQEEEKREKKKPAAAAAAVSGELEVKEMEYSYLISRWVQRVEAEMLNKGAMEHR